MASLAARAREKTDRLIRRGRSPIDALNDALKTYPAETEEEDGTTYAKFPDDSYLQLLNGEYAMVLMDNASRSNADKIIKHISLLCGECGRKMWCDHKGRGRDSDTFEFGDATVYVCNPCQRAIVEGYLVGE